MLSTFQLVFANYIIAGSEKQRLEIFEHILRQQFRRIFGEIE